MLAPIVLFVYNRPDHTRRTLEALSLNKLANQSDLYIYCDGPKPDADYDTIQNIRKVQNIAKEKKWCKNVFTIISDNNKGLATSIIWGVTEIINKFGKIIVLEDDIITSTGFLSFMNDALIIYENDEKVMHISSYLPKTSQIRPLPKSFFLTFMSCWGWATWKRAWIKFNGNTRALYYQISTPENLKRFNLDGAISFHTQLEQNLDGTINTWAIKWFSSIFLNNGLCLFPRLSLCDNIGFDGSGEHCTTKLIQTNFSFGNSIELRKITIKESLRGKKYLRRFYLYGRHSSPLNLFVFKLKNKMRLLNSLIKRIIFK
jgi:hypothetical protein